MLGVVPVRLGVVPASAGLGRDRMGVGKPWALGQGASSGFPRTGHDVPGALAWRQHAAEQPERAHRPIAVLGINNAQRHGIERAFVRNVAKP